MTVTRYYTNAHVMQNIYKNEIKRDAAYRTNVHLAEKFDSCTTYDYHLMPIEKRKLGHFVGHLVALHKKRGRISKPFRGRVFLFLIPGPLITAHHVGYPIIALATTSYIHTYIHCLCVRRAVWALTTQNEAIVAVVNSAQNMYLL